MQTRIIYDNTGTIYNVLCGESSVPGELKSMVTDLPAGMQIAGMDFSDPSNPKPVLKKTAASAYAELEHNQRVASDQIANLKAENEELTLAMADVLGGGV